MSITISKKRHDDNPNSFEHLYQLGLTYIQQLSGHIWTDYNTHDPGVTILEQVCYALTDLIYRCEFEVTDYLCETSGKIDYQAHGLALAPDIIPTYPQQSDEYETWLLNRLPELDKVWLRPNENIPHLGIYTIHAQLNHFYALSQHDTDLGGNTDEIQQQSAINSIRREFYQVRALGEDLAAIVLTGQNPLTLTATIHMSDDVTDVTRLTAQIFHNINLWLESNTQNTTIDVIKGSLLAETGILRIDQLQFTRYSESNDQSELTEIDHIAPYSYLRLPDSSDRLGVEIIQHQHHVQLNYSDLIIQIEKLEHQQRTAQLLTSNPPALPAGHYFDFSHYESIQTLFPRNYHLGPGTPKHYNAQQQGQRHQLRGYLLLFDQLMANFCDDISGLNTLFSLSLTSEKTYHHHLLQEDEFQNISQHYPKDAGTRLEQLRAQFDNYPERKNRLFNYLLALYSEHFPDELHRQFNPYFSAEAMEKQLLKYKRAFLLNITTMTNGRCIGDNLLQPGHRGGYSQRIALLLGLFPQSEQTLSYTGFITKFSLRIVQNRTYIQSDIGKQVLVELDDATTAHLQPLAENHSQEQVIEQQALHIPATISMFNEQTLPEVLLQSGINNHRYGIFYRQEHSDFLLFFKLDSEESKHWFYIAHHNDKQKLTQFCHLIQRWLTELNQASEGLYVIEPVLLRATENSDTLDNLANRLTIVFPGYTARFSKPKFREQVEQLIIANSPAHLLIQCLWLDFSLFEQFEMLYTHWRQAKANALHHQENQMSCDAAAQQLLHFLQTADTSTDKAAVI